MFASVDELENLCECRTSCCVSYKKQGRIHKLLMCDLMPRIQSSHFYFCDFSTISTDILTIIEAQLALFAKHEIVAI